MVRVVVPPAGEPVHLAELQAYLKLGADDVEETEYLRLLITAAREYCEGYQRRAYITRTLELTLDRFPRGTVQLPRGSLREVVSVSYTDAAGVEHTLARGADYVYSTAGVLGRVAPVTAWPCPPLFPVDSVRIRYVCGYGDTAASIPARVKQAMYLLIGYWYDNRSAVLIGSASKELEFSVKALLGPDRIAVI